MLGRFLEEPRFEFDPETTLSEPVDYDNDSAEPASASAIQEESPEASAEEYVESEELGVERTANASLYRNYLLETPAFSWLVGVLRRETTLTRADPDIMQDIKEKVLNAFPKPRISRRLPLQDYQVTFELDWDPLSFVQEQQYTEHPGAALERAITITGTGSEAQAIPTGEYLSQTWPTTGSYIMRLLTDVFLNERDHFAICKGLFAPFN